jgi:YD repeat-containing protein
MTEKIHIPLRLIDWVAIAVLALSVIALTTIAASAQQSSPSRARYYYGGEPHVGPASVGSMYDGSGRKVGQSYTHSDGSTTIYGSDGRVMGRAATDSQGTTTFYDAGGHVTGRAIPDGGR